MLFNSLEFLLFLPITFLLYWFVFKKSIQGQNILLLVASYIFYGWWDYRFLVLILASTLVDYTVGLALKREEASRSKRKLLLFTSFAFNLGLLFYFKYYNFFIESWVSAWESVGVVMDVKTLSIILPVGISFYTFQTLSYTIDVYKGKLEPTKNLVNFAVFVAFFPQLVAGPIERAANLLPQFSNVRNFVYDKAASGVYLIIWGLFKKVVVADNCAFFVNQIFENPEGFGSLELVLGAVLFAFQIYGDFSGYSDIAIGTARLFGLDLMTNFKFPYFSKDIADFWRRWHISLSTWFRDYVYIPLGGSRGGKLQQLRNVFVIFLVSGFWHGANWTFIVWGLIHSLLFLPLLLTKKNRVNVNNNGISFWPLLKIVFTFCMVTIAWVFFRADSVGIAVNYIGNMFSFQGSGQLLFLKTSKYLLLSLICFSSILLMLFYEFRNYRKQRDEVKLSFSTSLLYVVLIVFLGAFKNPVDFIYFQF